MGNNLKDIELDALLMLSAHTGKSREVLITLDMSALEYSIRAKKFIESCDIEYMIKVHDRFLELACQSNVKLIHKPHSL